MQEIKWSGFETIKGPVSEDEICQAVRDKSNKRVIAVDVIPPHTSAGGYMKMITTDNGPSTATENW